MVDANGLVDLGAYAGWSTRRLVSVVRKWQGQLKPARTTKAGERGSLRVPATRRKGTMRSGAATLLADESRAPIPEHRTPLAMTRGRDDSERGELLSMLRYGSCLL